MKKVLSALIVLIVVIAAISLFSLLSGKDIENVTVLNYQVLQTTNYNMDTGIPVSVWGVDVDWNNQYIWFADEDTNYIRKYYLNGTFISQFPTYVGVSEYTRGVTQNGTYIWAINTNKKIYQYFMNGTPTGFNFSIASLDDAYDLDTDNNYIYISNQYPRRVYKYTMAGSYVSYFTPSQLNTYGGSITVWDGYIWVAQNYQITDKRVFKYYVNGTYTGDNFTYTTNILKTIDTNGINFWGASDVDKRAYKF